MRPSTAFSVRRPAMALCDVIRCGYFQQVRTLVDVGLDVDKPDAEGKTPLILCAFIEPESWGVGIARILIENGANVSTQDRYGLNAFHYVCIYGRFQLARILLNAIDFDLNQIDRFGNTALHYAVRAGNSMITKLIVQCLKRYNLPFDTPNKQDHTALQEAYKLKFLSCVKLLEDDDTFEIPCDDTNLILGFENIEPKNKPKRCLRECCRNVTLPGRYERPESTAKAPKPNKKNPERIIKCASPKDFRNTKENIFKLTALPFDDLNSSEESLPTITRPKSAFISRRDSESSSDSSCCSWRDELRTLYQNFEFQCSRSWRRPVKRLEIKIEAPTIDEEAEKLKDKRCRRPSYSRLGLSLDLHGQRRRSSFSPKISRKGSTSDKRSPSGDNISLGSSTDSVSSVTPRSKNNLSPRSTNQ
ncbi:uncharacterized protein LOC126818634 [Patella vulgata]|uniref:uncharacterized protein LOC126818634 n=1 Tax=Patella vulgata TaxID=6465 RepID=UPI00217FFB72|nr:uncharacterized protein LOC126818634 [Patella vulgata]